MRHALAASSLASGNTSNLLRSVSGGATSTALAAPSNFFYNILFFTGALWVDPFSANRIVVVEALAASIASATTARASSGWSQANTYWIDHHNVVADPGYNGATRSAAVGFLAGDVSGFRSVNVADIATVKARLNQPVGAGNFRYDLNTSGTIDAADVAIVKSHSGQALAP